MSEPIRRFTTTHEPAVEPLYWVYSLKQVGVGTEVEVFAEWSDPSLSYEYDDWALIRANGSVLVVSTAGCSCPSPDETARAEGAFASLDDALAWLRGLDAEDPRDGWHHESAKSLLAAYEERWR